MSIYVILSLIILCLAIGGFAIGYYFMRLTFYPKVFSHEKIYNDEIERRIVAKDNYDLLEKETVWIDTGKAYKLKGYWIPTESAYKTVIIVHGYTNNIKGTIRYKSIFNEKGFNILIYDQRYHGESGGNNCTFGYHEKNDLVKVLGRGELKAKVTIKVHGASGSALKAIEAAGGSIEIIK